MRLPGLIGLAAAAAGANVVQLGHTTIIGAENSTLRQESFYGAQWFAMRGPGLIHRQVFRTPNPLWAPCACSRLSPSSRSGRQLSMPPLLDPPAYKLCVCSVYQSGLNIHRRVANEREPPPVGGLSHDQRSPAGRHYTERQTASLGLDPRPGRRFLPGRFIGIHRWRHRITERESQHPCSLRESELPPWASWCRFLALFAAKDGTDVLASLVPPGSRGRCARSPQSWSQRSARSAPVGE
jgi:hypothetical protein